MAGVPNRAGRLWHRFNKDAAMLNSTDTPQPQAFAQRRGEKTSKQRNGLKASDSYNSAMNYYNYLRQKRTQGNA